MMNKSRSLLLLSVLAVLFAACEEGIFDNAVLSQDYSEPEYSITVSPSELSFPAEGGEEKVLLELSQSLSWTATTNASWITLSDNSGTDSPSPAIHVVVAENTSVESRTGTVTFKTREKTATLTVTQDATQPVLAANVNVLTFPFGGGSQEISITSNARWTVVNPSSWLSLSADSGTGDATLTVTAAENSTTFFRQGTLTLNYGGEPVSIAFLQHATPDLNGHAYVDLGLPSGLLWATCNVGATTPEGYGDYFAWGETAKKNSYTWANYKWSEGGMQSLTKYNSRNDYGIVDNLSELLLSDDAAVVNWGGCWRMPTYAEWEELCNTDNCTWTPLHNNGHCEGYKVTSTRNGNSIFLPSAGLHSESGLDGANMNGNFWASTLFSLPNQGYGLYFDYAGHPHAFSRYQGLSVRPIGKMTLHFSLTPTTIDFPATSSSETLSVTANQPWTATTSDAWLTLSNTSGEGDATLTISAEENASITSRTGTVTFQTGATTYAVSVTQKGATPIFEATPSSLSYSASGGSETISITSNQSWTATTSDAWFNISAAAGEGNATLTVTAEGNSSIAERTGKVTFSAGGKTYTVNITQKGADPILSVTPETLSFSAEGGNKSISVTSNSSWTATSSEAWLTLSNNSGEGDATLSVTAEENTSIANRTASVTIKGDGGTFTVNVTQEGAIPLFDVTPTSLSFTAEGGSTPVKVSSNQTWAASVSADWITLSAMEGTGDATLSLTVEANTSIAERTGTATFNAGGKTYTVSITQKGAAPVLSVSPESLSFSAEGGNKSISVTSNSSWTATSSDAWLTLSNNSGEGDATLTLTAEENTTTANRTASVTFKGKDTSFTVNVTQEGANPAFSVTPTTLSFTSSGGNQSVSIKSNQAWTVSFDVSWLSLSTASGTGDATVSITAQANTYTDNRAGTVTFTSGGKTYTVTVIQDGAAIHFEITPTTITFTAKGGSKSVSVMSNQPWTVSSDVSWLKLSDNSGTGDATLPITVEENTIIYSRLGTLTFDAGERTYTLSVIQEAASPFFSVSPDALSFTSSAGSKSISVSSNISWTASSDVSWLTLSKSAGDGNASLSLTVEENASISSRSGAATFKADGKTYTVTVSQAGADPTFSVSPTSLSFASSGGNKSVTLKSNQSWTAKSSVSWLTLSKTSGTGDTTVSITAQANTSTDNRSGKVTFSAGGKTYTVNVSQDGVPTYFEITPTTLSFTSKGGSKSVSVMSNQPWTVSADASWLKLSDNSGTSDATLSITTEENTSTSSRSGTVTFKAGGKTYNISVTQAGADPTFSVTPTTLSFTASAGSKSVSITSNTSWTASSSVSWLTLSKTSGTGNASISLSTEANTSTSSRSGTATFKANGKTYTVNVTQAGADPTFSVTPTSLSFTSSSGSKSITVTSNLSWAASSDVSWLTLSNSSGLGNATLTLTTEANTSTNSRSATVTFSAGGKTYTVSISQAGADPTFSVTPTTLSFTSSGGNKSITVTSNLSWTASSNVTWITLSNSSGLGNATLTITTEANASTNSRSGTVTFSAGGKNYTVSVTQTGADPTFSVTPTTLSFVSSGGSQSITLKSNQSWTASSSVTWLTLSKTSGTGDATLTLTAQANTSTDNRSGIVTFTAGGKTYTVTASQNGVATYFEITPTTLSFTSSGGSKSVSVMSNQPWTVSADASWLKLSDNSGTSDATLSVTAEENTSTSSRSGTITFKAGGNTYTVSVTQEEANPTFSVTPEALSFTASGGNQSVSVTSNQAWTASTADVWLTLSGTSGTGNASLTITAQANKSAGNRTGSITFNAGGTSKTVSVTQAGVELAKAYLTFEALENTTFTFSQNDLQYSLDGGATWTTLTAGTASPTVQAGNRIMWKASLTPGSGDPNYGIGSFSSTGKFNAEGNIMSLLFGDDFVGQKSLYSKDWAFYRLFENTKIENAENLVLPATTLAYKCYEGMFNGCTSLMAAPTLPATTLAERCYYWMFFGCTSLTTAPELPATTLAVECYSNMFNGCTSFSTAPKLPATTLAMGCYYWMFYRCASLTNAPELPAATLAYACYGGMFEYCTNLTAAPELPATKLATNCYESMFLGCTSLTTAPELPATSLTEGCYERMFMNCTSLTTAPELPATTLATTCYAYLFEGCTKLNYIKCLATDISATGCTSIWVKGVASSGTFVKNASMTGWTTGDSGIPSGWTVQGDGFFVTPTAFTFAASGGSQSVSVTSNQSWTASSSVTWLTLSKTSGTGNATLTLTAQANTSTDNRSGIVTFTAGGKTYSVTISQDGGATYFEITPTTLSFSASGGSKSISVMSNQPWTVSANASWLKLSDNSGTSDATLSVTAEENTTTTSRSGTITFSAGGNSYIVKVTQAEAVEKKPYLTFEALESTTFTFSQNDLQYSLDGGATWTTLTAGTASPTIQAGEKIMWKESGLTPDNDFGIGTFSSTSRFNVEGNIMSLLYGDNFVGKTSIQSNAFRYLFRNCTKLEKACNLVLPATTLAESCYLGLFKGCSNLINAPVLPATTLAYAYNCYKEMFRGCTSLASAPELPATKLSADCYANMFYGCTSLITTPTLPATTLANLCYYMMFAGCTSLTTASALPATTLAFRCYSYMFKECTSLTSTPALPATTLANSCYEGMFSGCTSLTTAPSSLPATTLEDCCYQYMFEGCASLILAPELPATSLEWSCYNAMFRGCTSLTTASELPATTLAQSCYYQMFQGCTKLNYIKCLATDISATNCTTGWVKNVASSGTFVKNASMTGWTIGDNGIPIGWTVQGDGFFVTPAAFSFAASGGSQSVSVTSNQTWTASSSVSWLTLSKNSGTGDSSVSISAQANTSTDNRAGIVTFTAGGKTYTITISQDGVPTYFEITPTTLSFASSGGSKSVSVMSNQPWTASVDVSWLKLADNSGTGDATLSVTAEENTTTSSRSGTITFSAGGNSYTINVTQAGAVEKKPYLTFEALENTTFTFSQNDLQYSLDGGATWTTLTAGTASPTVQAGDRIMWKASGLTPQENEGIGTFSSTGRFNAEGNIMSLFYGDNCVGQTSLNDKNWAFYQLFYNSNVVNAEKLVLPATTLANSCYQSMFWACTSLTTAPELPATTLADYCYYAMFINCTSLTKAPELPATTLADYCYQSMFSGCTSLTTASELPATTLVEGCYCYMFRDCTSLTKAPELPATTLADRCYLWMFDNCTSLTTAQELPATSLADNCYAGMFRDCTSLTTAPELPATTLATYCYSSMFNGCTSLNTAPKLPATTLADYCYRSMFEGCTSLSTAPELPATTLATYCYSCMFLECTSLSFIKCIATDISAFMCTTYWVSGVASSGMFVKNASMTGWPTGTNGIPSGWTVKDFPEGGNTEEHEYVDLGLPSGTLWATCNVGASSPEEYGDYFAWGETEPKSDYSFSYKWYGSGKTTNLTKYNTSSEVGMVDNKTVLDLDDDAAAVNWGEGWRIPTNAEWTELLNNCTWTWTAQYSHDGYKVTSKSNGNSIFLPAAGYCEGTSLEVAGNNGYYWSSSLDGSSPGLAWGVYINSSGINQYSSLRYRGRSVRPVYKP